MSLSSGDEVAHIFTRKSRLRPKEFLIASAKRLLQQNRPQAELLHRSKTWDVFDDKIERLAEEYGDRETALEIAEEDHKLLRFYLPPEARWAVISGREQYDWPNDEQGRSTRPKDIGEHLTKAVRAVMRQNPSLTGVIDVVDFAAERNGERDVNPLARGGLS